METLAGEYGTVFRSAEATFSVSSDRQSIMIANDKTAATTAVVSLYGELVARPTSVSTLAYVVLGEGEDPTSLELSRLRARAEYVLSSLEREDTSAFAAPLDQRQTIALKEGLRLAFFEVAGNSIADASSFTLLQPTELDPGTIELSTAQGMVVRLIGQASGEPPLLASFIARDQGDQPLFNLCGLKPSDTLTGQLVLAREANFNTDAGFYRIENAAGAVWDAVSGVLILPGEPGYAEAALAQSVGSLSRLQIADGTSAVAEFSLPSEAFWLLAPFAVVQADAMVNTYFAYDRANPDRRAHFRTLGDNIFALEDQLGGGDNDFDDLVVGFRSLALA